jgi:hypothetical protein
MAEKYRALSTVPEERTFRVRLLGVNDTHPTEQIGPGVTVTRTGEGAYLITWAESPGYFVGWSWAFGATTPADLKGYTAVRGVYSASAKTLAFVVYNSSFTAADLIAAQYADLAITFADSSVVAA